MASAGKTVRAARIFLPLVLLATVSCSGPGTSSEPSLRRPAPALRVPPGIPEAEVPVRLLNRFAFGPSPSDLAEVRRLGPEGWLRRQLDPGSIDDAALEAKLRTLASLHMTTAELHDAYPEPKPGAVGTKDRDPAHAPRVIGRELASQKVLRAVESRRQLQEVLTDFWFNHFNVFAAKGQDRWLVTAYERDAIRPNVFGRFRDLLGATAAAPAMLFYLDNWTSTREGPASARGARRGINENYARELLELHTLGVDGGYSQRDVREVARCFTGWSIERPRESGSFVFRAGAHDRGAKVVLGVAIPAGGGRDDGEKVLDLLARHPSTARFVARKLCQRFVADDPPAPLVARVAAVYLRTDGDLREVYAAIASSPELWSAAESASKTKSPLELAASAVRALGAHVDDPVPLAEAIGRMGEPLYRCQPPTGYGETATAWVAGGLLLDRLRFGQSLAAGKIRGTAPDLTRLSGTPEPRDVVERVALAILGHGASAATRRAIEDALRDGSRGAPPAPALAAGLLLASPDFQRR